LAIEVLLVDERGERIPGKSAIDYDNSLHRLLPLASPNSSFLRYIDFNADTYFNLLQAADFLKEWTSLYDFVETDEEKAIVDGVASLARELAMSIHVYLKFEGD
jgi:hypothetical protein